MQCVLWCVNTPAKTGSHIRMRAIVISEYSTAKFRIETQVSPKQQLAPNPGQYTHFLLLPRI